jgi:hypothetical protein
VVSWGRIANVDVLACTHYGEATKSVAAFVTLPVVGIRPPRNRKNTADLALERLDWDALSFDARWTARNLANPLIRLLAT